MSVRPHTYTVEPVYSMGLSIPNAWRVMEDGTHFCRTAAKVHADEIAEAMHDYDVKRIAQLRQRVEAA